MAVTSRERWVADGISRFCQLSSLNSPSVNNGDNFKDRNELKRSMKIQRLDRRSISRSVPHQLGILQFALLVVSSRPSTDALVPVSPTLSLIPSRSQQPGFSSSWSCQHLTRITIHRVSMVSVCVHLRPDPNLYQRFSSRRHLWSILCLHSKIRAMMI